MKILVPLSTEMKSKKAQIHMMETIGVLVIFFIIIVLSLVFYFKVNKNTSDQLGDEFKGLERIKLAQQFAVSLPELQCSEYGIIDSACIDEYMLESAIPTFELYKNTYYFNLFGYSKITVSRIYPILPLTNDWSIYDRRGDPNQRPQISRSYFPMTLYNPVTGMRSFAIMTIEVYQ